MFRVKGLSWWPQELPTEEELQKAYHTILRIKESCEDYSLLKPLKIPNLKWIEPNLGGHYNKIAWCSRIPYLYEFLNSDFKGDNVLAEAIIKKVSEDETLQNEETYNEINENLKSTWISSNVNKTHWSAYYLNLQNIIEVCWNLDTLVGPGRGSGVGFLLLYIDSNGDAWSEENPNGKWQTCKIGDFFSLPLILSDGSETHSALNKDIDW